MSITPLIDIYIGGSRPVNVKGNRGSVELVVIGLLALLIIVLAVPAFNQGREPAQVNQAVPAVIEAPDEAPAEKPDTEPAKAE